MTEIQFHFNVPERLGYACRLLRKATRQGALVVVTAPAPTLVQLDRALWSFDPLEFIPHLLVKPGENVAPRMKATPVWLCEDPLAAPHQQVLLNLGLEPAEGFASFARLIEIVSTDDDDRQAGRARWKHYAGRGYDIKRHEVGGE